MTEHRHEAVEGWRLPQVVRTYGTWIRAAVTSRIARAKAPISDGRGDDTSSRKTPHSGEHAMTKEELISKYQETSASKLPNTFSLYRILGNNIGGTLIGEWVLHSLANILAQESNIADCQKYWILNRIVDGSLEEKIITKLNAHNQEYLRIPFNAAEYEMLRWDAGGFRAVDYSISKSVLRLSHEEQMQIDLCMRRSKNLYLFNENGARNFALWHGRSRTKWIVPLDGNCYFSDAGFESLREAAISEPWFPYLVLEPERHQISRNLDNSPNRERAAQIAFRSDAEEIFDPDRMTCFNAKSELLWRIGVDNHQVDDLIFDPKPLFDDQSVRPGQCRLAGHFVVQAPIQGSSEIEPTEPRANTTAQIREATAFIDNTDFAVQKSVAADRLTYYDIEIIRDLELANSSLTTELRSRAETALTEGVFSVVDKRTLPPSGNPHDYWHPAPYWWPDPSKPDGLPYIRHDGKRIDGTNMYSVGSEKFDRTRLQKMFDNTTVLSLATTAFGDERYGRHAADIVRIWFLNEETKMTPHLKYSQVRSGHGTGQNPGSGIIEFKNMYYFLDAVRLLAHAGFLTRNDELGFRKWLLVYLAWLVDSSIGKNEETAGNNHGTFYDVQLGAIATYLGRTDLISKIKNRAPLRLQGQLGNDGRQVRELKRAIPIHYTAFNLAGWMKLTRSLESFGEDCFTPDSIYSIRLKAALEWLADELMQVKREGEFDLNLSDERFQPLWYDYNTLYRNGTDTSVPHQASFDQPVVHPDNGISPFWMFAKNGQLR